MANAPRTSRTVILALFLVSGACGLVYEVLWVRQLSLVFGATVFAVSAVLAAFMAGMAIGSWAIGRAADRWPTRGLAIYGVLQLGIGLYALAVPHLIPAFTPLYIWARGELGLSFASLTALKLAATFLVLLPATVLMGGTLPPLVRYVTATRDELGRRVAALYGANTLGAVVGCVGAAFVLVSWLGVRSTLHLAAVLNATAGLLALALSRAAPAEQEVASQGDSAVEQSRPVVLWLYALGGFCALGYEALWTRMLAHVVGTNVQAFALMLTAFLLGIAVGSLLVSFVRPLMKRPLLALAAIEVLVGCAALLSIPAFVSLPSVDAQASIWVGLAQALAVMLAPATLMGAAFPIAARAYNPSLQHAGAGVGRLYAANTLGAVLGSVVAGFVLVPLVGAQAGVFALALLNAAVGLGLAAAAWRPHRGAAASIAGIGLAAVAACALVAAPLLGRPLIDLRRPPEDYDTLYYSEGISSSIAVLRSRLSPTAKELDVNGVPVAVTHYEDFKIQKLLVHLPLLLHPEPKQTLLIGFGTGSTAYGATLHGGHVTCVELEAGQCGAAKFFRELNHGVERHPRFSLYVDDGRNWLLTVPRRYDVIARDTLQPKQCQDLFTREFYQLCRNRLEPGGMLSAILPIDLCPDEAYFKDLIRTFQSVFPHTSLWYVGPQLALLVGGTEPLRIDWPLWRKRYQNPALVADLKLVDLQDPAAMASYLLMAGDTLRSYTGEGPVVTDDKPLGFWRTRERLSRREAKRIADHFIERKVSAAAYIAGLDDPARLARAERVAKLVIAARTLAALGEWPAAAKKFEAALAISPDDANAKRGCSRAYNKLANEQYEKGYTARAERLLRDAIRLDPTFVQAHLGLARCLERQGLHESAREAYERAAALCPALRESE